MKTLINYNTGLADKIIEWTSGDGLKSDGVNDYILTTHPSIVLGSPFSFNFFAKLTGVNASGVLFCNGRLTNSRYILFSKSGGLYNCMLLIYEGGYLEPQMKRFTTNYIFLPNVNYNINISYSGTQIKIYVNNIEVTASTNKTVSTNSSATSVTTFFRNNRSGDEEYLDATLYDFKIFNKVLTEAEITELYMKQGQTIPHTCVSNCTAWWDFSDKQGTVLRDKSGNGNNGTLVNFADTTLGPTNAWVDKYGNPITQY
jgi:hypothetical protein